MKHYIQIRDGAENLGWYAGIEKGCSIEIEDAFEFSSRYDASHMARKLKLGESLNRDFEGMDCTVESFDEDTEQ